MRASILLVPLVAVGLLAAACGSDSDSGAGGEAATTTAAAGATTAAPAGKGGTFAIVLPSSKDDKSFSQSGYDGLLAGIEAVGGTSLFQENVQVPQAEEAFRNLASQKPTAVIGLGGQFADAGAAVAKEFPDVQFVVINGSQQGPNLSSWSLAEGEVAYLAGILAASLKPETTKVGRVAGLEITPLKFGTSGFILGARSVNPDMEYVWSFTGDFDDVAKAKEATLAAIKSGATIIYTGMNNGIAGQEQAAEEEGALLMNNTTPKCDDPKVGKLYLGGTASNTTFAVESVVKGLADGSLQPGFKKTNLEYPDGFKVISCAGAIPADVQAKIDAAAKQLIDGTVTIPLEPPAS